MKTLICKMCGDVTARTKVKLDDVESISFESIDFPQGHKVGDLSMCKECGFEMNIMDPDAWTDND